MDRAGLADFLRSRRSRVMTSDVGLPEGVRRRTPGLRREEVAELAAISVDYYTRLEQARGPHPSRQVLTGIQRALRLSDDERNHLFHLAGEQPGPPATPPRDIRPGIRHLLDRLDDAAVFVLDAKYEIIAWNPLAAALLGDFGALAPKDRNLIRSRFLVNKMEQPFDTASSAEFGVLAAGHLRAASARYPDDPALTELLAELLAGSSEFAGIWAAHDVTALRSLTKTVDHALVGRVELDCEVLLIPERDQQVIMYTAEPASASHEALQELKARVLDRAHLADRASHAVAEPAGDVRGGTLRRDRS